MYLGVVAQLVLCERARELDRAGRADAVARERERLERDVAAQRLRDRDRAGVADPVVEEVEHGENLRAVVVVGW